MYLNFIISSLLCGILNFDNFQIGQFSFSRPSFVGLIIGYLNGCPFEGASMGIILELCYLDFMPLGGSVPPNGAVAASIAVMVFTFGKASVPFAFFSGFFSGFAYSKADCFLRKKRGSWNVKIEDEINKGEFKINYWISKSLAQENFATIVFAAFGSALFIIFWKYAVFDLLSQTLKMTYFMILWAALAGAVLKFKKQIMGKNGKKR